jgi:hypothetical protein
MAYSAPFHWEHGSAVTAARMQIYSDDIAAIYARQNGIDINPPVMFISVLRTYTAVHRYRWLHYRGEGYMELFAGTDKHRTSLNSAGAWYAILDLDSLSSWLFAGDLYVIAGVSWALESPYA